MPPDAGQARECIAPAPEEGARIPGGFFRWPGACESPWRWDPLARRDADGDAVGEWVAWPIPEPPAPSLMQRVMKTISLSGDDNGDESKQADADGPKKGNEDKEGDEETAAKAATEMYAKAVERHRDSLKWFVVAAGAVATAAVGTAPLSGLAQVIPGPGGGYAGTGFVLLVTSLVFILVAVALVLRPAGTNTAELGSSPLDRGTWEEKKWLERIQAQYSGYPTVFLDGKARSLREYRDYRAAWLGAAADIDRALLTERDFGKSAKLKKYAEIADARLRADDDSVSTNIQRGILEIVRRRAAVTTIIVIALIVVAIAGFLLYLYGIGVAGRPAIESLTTTPSAPASGDDIVIRAVVTGDKLTFSWTHDSSRIRPTDESVFGGEGPVLRIGTADEADAGEYKLTVTDGDGQAASKTIDVEVAPPT
jgi:hypothetical protein